MRVPDVLVLEVDTYPAENPKVSLLDFVCSSGSTLVLSPFLQAGTSDAIAQGCNDGAPPTRTQIRWIATHPSWLIDPEVLAEIRCASRGQYNIEGMF